MIMVRRGLAGLLILLLVPVFTAAAVLWRVDSTLLDPGFYREQVAAVAPFDIVHDEVLPNALDDFLREQETRLPENLSGVQIPSDQESKDSMLELARTAAPPELLTAITFDAIDQVIPYLSGERDDVAIRIRLGDRLQAVAGREDGAPSMLQRTWHDLDLADSVIRSLAAQGPQDELAAGALHLADETSLMDRLEPRMPAATAWFEREFFGAVDSMLPFLLGDDDGFTVNVRFDEFPELAEILAEPLNSSPASLLRDGYVFDDARIRAELSDSERESLADVERSLSIFRESGYVITQDDIFSRESEPEGPGTTAGEGGETDNGVETARTVFGLVGVAVWVAIALVAVLVALVGILGGRTWRSRAAWSATSLMIASAALLVVSGPVYLLLANPIIDEELARVIADHRAETAAPLIEAVLQRVGDIADHSARALAAVGGMGLAASGLLLTILWRTAGGTRSGVGAGDVEAPAERAAA